MVNHGKSPNRVGASRGSVSYGESAPHGIEASECPCNPRCGSTRAPESDSLGRSKTKWTSTSTEGLSGRQLSFGISRTSNGLWRRPKKNESLSINSGHIKRTVQLLKAPHQVTQLHHEIEKLFCCHKLILLRGFNTSTTASHKMTPTITRLYKMS